MRGRCSQRSFSPSTTSRGHKDSAATKSHWGKVRAVVLKRAARGGNSTTLTMRKAHSPQAATSYRVENRPSFRTECSERMLKLWTSWDRLSTQKAMVRPTVGLAGSTSKKTRPRV